MRDSVKRIRLVLTDLQWEHLERAAATSPTEEVLAEFWRIALGYSTSEWSELSPKSFRVWDYELSFADHARLHFFCQGRSKSERKASALAWLNIAPACQDLG